MSKLSVRPLPAPFYPIIFLLFYTLTFLLFIIYSLSFLPFYFSIVRGLVIKNTGSWYTVKTEDGKTIDSKIKGNFRLKGIRSTNPVAVGDYVVITPHQEGTAFITEIEDRRNYIIRKSPNLSKQSHIIAANIDQAFLIVTVNYPETSTTFIDRFLAGAEAYRIPVTLVFNKRDLLSDDELRYQHAVMNLYETIGFQCGDTETAAGRKNNAVERKQRCGEIDDHQCSPASCKPSHGRHLRCA